ncbi:MAG: tRNA-specific adenosine deaminase [Gammaproteobacteria bacterium TMED242]|nr:MAG: tRNA-specific adenosine deaminase [Gammaproteobacteria bacterium TMED242]|tara:strand:- start:66 stop:521 length:456 start_codon:yes stop_codon:yes gene_type:complete
MFKEQDRSYMKLAIAQAKKAYISNEVPIGAVIVLDNKVIGVGRNKVIEVNDVSSHAEMNAIENASKKIKNYRLNRSTIFITLEPCHMCAKAIVDARIDRVVFAAPEPKSGCLISIDNLYERIKFNHQVKFEYGLLKEESATLLKDFFKERR